MSTVPNRYYNSPYIEDAARNLASALAPPDPEKTLAAQRDKWKFEREQELAQIEDEQRERRQGAAPAISRLISNDYGSAIYDTPGIPPLLLRPPEQREVDPNAPTREKDLQNVSGAGYNLSDVMALSGDDNPKTRSAIAVLERKLQNQNLRDDQRAELQLQLQYLRNGGAWDRTMANINSREGMQRAGFENQEARDAREYDHDLALVQARSDAQASKNGTKPVKVWGPIYKDIRREVLGFEKQLGYPLDIGDRRELMARIGEELNNNPNVPDAADVVFKRYLLGDESGKPPTKVVDVPGKYFGTNKKTFLDPRVQSGAAPAPAAAAAAPAPAPSGGDLAGALFPNGIPSMFEGLPPGPVAPPRAAPAPAAQTTAAGADEVPPIEMFENPGEALEMDDGSVWAVIDGKVTRLDKGG